ncbi:acyl-CoA dehydrogenase family protein [Streptomyces sp. NPDC001812]|uniref:Acyl-CoA dehydrogenase n=1 Tax=Streptomyces cathayae TaxID=3031124 RepID=A0ABY8JUJ8_9ACTN|nr:acyl-CoA dehydrogenase family protein [Streptomyces sp. HUAS 5]WGD39662.1 hypothetical protein PYS65_05670 [Streptomyces sp. HUAS 5]
MSATAARPQADRPTLVERARLLVPGIAERASETEKMRHVHEDSLKDLADSGLARALQAKVYGGEEANPAEFFLAATEISKACASTGWIMMLLGVHSWELAHMSKELNDEIFGADPEALISSSYNMQGNKATRVEGGFRLSGTWRSSSGIHHAKWVVVGADVPGEVVPYNFFFPIEDAKVVDDWYTLGLNGTGSRTVVVDDIFIPEHRAIDRGILYGGFGPGLREFTAPLYRLPHAHIYTMVSAAPALGTGWRFLEEFKSAYGVSKTVSRSLEGDRLMLVRLAEARGALSAAQTVTVARLQEAYDAACRGEELSTLEIAQAMYDIAQNGKAGMSVVSSLFPALRPNAVYSSNIMQRLYRDLIVAREHGTSNGDAQAEPLAMIDLGLAGGHLLFPPADQREAARLRAQAKCYI